MKIFLIASLSFFLTSTKTYCQSKRILTIDEMSRQITDNFQKYYKPDNESLKRFCRRGCLFMRFKVDSNQQIIDKAFSKDSALVICSALSGAIDSLKKDRKLLFMLSKLKSSIIIPVIYDYQLGCDIPPVNLKGTKDEGVNRMFKYYEIMEEMDHFHDTLFNMLNFQGTKLKSIKCLLLEPIRIGASKEYF